MNKANAKKSGAIVPNRAAVRAAEKNGITFCQQCRRVLKYAKGEDGVRISCACGVKLAQPSAAAIARAERKDIPAPVKMTRWHRAVGLFLVLTLGLIALVVNRVRTGKWGRR